MKKLSILLAAIAIQFLSVAVSANCIATGTIVKASLASGGSGTIGVRSNSPGSTLFSFTLSALDLPRATLFNTAVAAEASHITVTVEGSASTCGAVIGGQSAGGNVKSIILSP